MTCGVPERPRLLSRLRLGVATRHSCKDYQGRCVIPELLVSKAPTNHERRQCSRPLTCDPSLQLRLTSDGLNLLDHIATRATCYVQWEGEEETGRGDGKSVYIIFAPCFHRPDGFVCLTRFWLEMRGDCTEKLIYSPPSNFC